MIRSFSIFILLFLTGNLFAQTQPETTTSFTISGKVKAEKVISITHLQLYPTIKLKNISTSCSSRKEEMVKSVKAVLLKNILDSVAFDYEKKSMLNHYYFLFVASDGYKIVFSFNEIYNTEVGNNLYIVTEMEGKKIGELENGILMLSTKDIKGGSRNMKWLSKIVVCVAD